MLGRLFNDRPRGHHKSARQLRSMSWNVVTKAHATPGRTNSRLTRVAKSVALPTVRPSRKSVRAASPLKMSLDFGLPIGATQCQLVAPERQMPRVRDRQKLRISSSLPFGRYGDSTER